MLSGRRPFTRQQSRLTDPAGGASFGQQLMPAIARPATDADLHSAAAGVANARTSRTAMER